jgi:hypothetical protein
MQALPGPIWTAVSGMQILNALLHCRPGARPAACPSIRRSPPILVETKSYMSSDARCRLQYDLLPDIMDTRPPTGAHRAKIAKQIFFLRSAVDQKLTANRKKTLFS